VRAWALGMCLGVAATAAPVGAQEGQGSPASRVSPFDVPWTDRAPTVERLGGAAWLTVAALGMPDPRAGRLALQRSTARERAWDRALAALHGWVDDALARVWAHPRVATAAHGAVRASARTLGTRPLTDGSAVVVVGIPVERLAAVAPLEGMPWAR
jgi:hypothetical protein